VREPVRRLTNARKERLEANLARSCQTQSGACQQVQCRYWPCGNEALPMVYIPSASSILPQSTRPEFSRVHLLQSSKECSASAIKAPAEGKDAALSSPGRHLKAGLPNSLIL